LRAESNSALSEWITAIGHANVSSSTEELGRASTGTFATSSRVVAILRPASREETQQCVRIANQYRTPVYPISSGKNWGYGSRVPVTDAVLLDLSRLNRICDFDEDLAYITVEPGVTQRQLYEFLQARQSRLWMDATGSSPECSVIGNTLERGFGHTPMGDHCSNVCGFEVVLPSGDCIETGFARFSNTKTGALSRWGVGPSLDGLFSQSNLGIVTRMTVWLMPAPERVQAFFLQTDGSIGPVIEALRPLRLRGIIRSVMHLGNDYKVLSSSGEYPWDAAGGRTPLSAEMMADLRKNRGVARWSGSGGLYGTRHQVREARSLLRHALAGKVKRLQFVDEGSLRFIRAVEKPYRLITGRQDLRRGLTLVPPLLKLLKGIPTDEFLSSVYWRKRAPIRGPVDPDVQRCGLLWCSPVAPLTGMHTTEVTDIATEVVLAHGFEPIISVSIINERMTISTIALTYDRDVAGEDDRAQNCYRTLMQRLLDRGYPPYRLNVASMNYAQTGDVYSRLLDSIKRSLDPNGILAPGRYH
jgi:4-cresol dehydrogenase (hydroxylating)